MAALVCNVDGCTQSFSSPLARRSHQSQHHVAVSAAPSAPSATPAQQQPAEPAASQHTTALMEAEALQKEEAEQAAAAKAKEDADREAPEVAQEVVTLSCHNCGTRGSAGFARCSRCRSVWFCSKTCQVSLAIGTIGAFRLCCCSAKAGNSTRSTAALHRRQSSS